MKMSGGLIDRMPNQGPGGLAFELWQAYACVRKSVVSGHSAWRSSSESHGANRQISYISYIVNDSTTCVYVQKMRNCSGEYLVLPTRKISYKAAMQRFYIRRCRTLERQAYIVCWVNLVHYCSYVQFCYHVVSQKRQNTCDATSKPRTATLESDQSLVW